MTEAELIDAILRQSVELQRLSQGEEAKAAAILSALEDDLRALLTQGNLSDKSKREIEALIKEAHKAITGQYVNIAGVLDLEAVVQHVADQTVDFLDDTFPIAIGNPSIATLQSLSRDILIDGSPASAWWAKQAEDTAFKFAGNVRRGVLEGKTNEQIVRDVVADMDVSRRNARTLVHSSIMTAANQARLATYKKNMKGAMGVKWLATLDSHTCHTCANLDGSEWDFDGKKLGKTRMEFQAAPAHWACRCIMTPVPNYAALNEISPGLGDRLKASGERASSNGPVKSGTTFADFLKRQPDAWVREYLGAERAELYLSGKITLSDLVTKGGREKTLEELAR